MNTEAALRDSGAVIWLSGVRERTACPTMQKQVSNEENRCLTTIHSMKISSAEVGICFCGMQTVTISTGVSV